MALLIYFVMLDCRILPKYIALYLLYNLAKGYNIILLKFMSGLCKNTLTVYVCPSGYRRAGHGLVKMFGQLMKEENLGCRFGSQFFGFEG